jgi:transglutaminase-like putative cysteine protease
MLLEITHENVFQYGAPVSESFLELRLTPLTDGSQHLLQHRQRVTPAAPMRQYVDALGNTVTYFNHMAPLDRIEVGFDSVVETLPTRCRGTGASPEELASPAMRLQLFDYLRPTALTAPSDLFRSYAAQFRNVNRAAVEETAWQIADTLFRSFRYEGSVTDASSSIDEILTHGAGVCQDFAHLMIALLRDLGIAARYVSGYVLPEGDPDQPVASHAWCEVFDPSQGWLGIDPTHNCWVEERYVRLGVGRDFRDVPPNRGLYRGLATEEMRVSVRIRPITSDDLTQRVRTLYGQPARPQTPGTRSARKAVAVSLAQQSLFAQQQQQQQQ